MHLCAASSHDILNMSQANTTTRHQGDALTGTLNKLGECGKMIWNISRPPAGEYAGEA
jgi:hypothetical protein